MRLDVVITDENRDRVKTIYLDGLCLAKRWLDDSKIRNDGTEKSFQNIFDMAFREYENLFGEVK
jgi:hypothetical protein